MGLSRENPVGIAATGQIQLDLASQLKQLHRKVEAADQARAPWLRKQKKLLEQRLGIRRKTNFPWPGASNESWPLTDSVIRRWKPAMVRLVLSSDPVAFFSATEPNDLGPAATAQLYYHWRFNQIPNVHRTVFELVDKIAQYGVAYTLQGWDYQTDRTARVVRTNSLFPGGVEQAHRQLSEQLAAQAEQSGQEPQPAPSAEEFVQITLATEYGLDPAVDGDMLAAATQAILDGKPYVKIEYGEVVADRPAWKVIDPMKVIRPPRGCDIATDEFVAVVHQFTRDELLRMARDGHIQAEALAAALERSRTRESDDGVGFEDRGDRTSNEYDQIAQILDTADGVEQIDMAGPKKETIWQVFTKLDLNGDGIRDRVVLWYHPLSKTLLSATDYVFPFKEWPIVEFAFEHGSDRPYSARGIPEHLYAYQKTRTRMHNARLDAAAITLSPMYQARSTINTRQLRPRPGLMIPVQAVGDFAPVPTDVKPLQFLLQEENITASQAEQYIGIFDPGVFAQNTPERRTATEVQAVTSTSDSVFSADAILFQRSMAAVHRQLWQLIMEFGPDEEFFRVTGEEVPRTARRGELDRNYDISPAGTPETTSRSIALRNATQAMQLALQDPSGVLDLAAAYRYFFDLLDRNLSKVVVRSTQEAQAMQLLNQLLARAQEKQ